MKLILFDRDYIKLFSFKIIFFFATILSIIFASFGGYNLYKNYKINKNWDTALAKITNIKISGFDTKGLQIEYKYIVKKITYTGKFKTLESDDNYVNQLKNKYKINQTIKIKYNPNLPEKNFFADSESKGFFIIFLSVGIISFFIFGGITLFLILKKENAHCKKNISSSIFQPNIKILIKIAMIIVIIFAFYNFYFFDFQLTPALFISIPFLIFSFVTTYLLKKMFTFYVNSDGIKSFGYKFPFFTVYFIDYTEITEVKKKGIILKYLFLYSSKNSYIKIPLFIDDFQAFKNKIIELTDESNKLRLYLQNNMT